MIRIIKKSFYRVEDFFSIAVLATMVILPLVQIITRKFIGVSIVGADSYFQHGTLWITFAGASLVARRGRHLRFAAMIKLPQRLEVYTKQFYTSISVAVSTVFVISAAALVQVEFEAPSFVAPFLPTWLAQLPMVLFMVSVTIHTLIRSSLSVKAILIVFVLAALILCINFIPEESRKILTWPGISLLLLALLFTTFCNNGRHGILAVLYRCRTTNGCTI